MLELIQAEVKVGEGLVKDRFTGISESKRQITLIQHEHLMAMASLLHQDEISANILRRNLVVKGINLLALKGQTFCINDVVLQTTGLCHPCSKMETTLGPGGYNAMRGHGGITAKVLSPGFIKIGDTVKLSQKKAQSH
ncbi:MOSC domain-containing protein [Thalassotalea fonticola]|uniref:MOSC domain-containing protein n=1 Tax=Thalassotalea fonticola TaxID=3065649 RepID=A0ABZ0GRP7_9GAMM|nr:MOSC domain-containing protein [Colwelliaceae bacterium S1-1]